MDNFDTSYIAQIGGTFIYSKNAERLADWYRTHLGISTEKHGTAYYASFYYYEVDNNKKACIAWAIMENLNRPELNEKVFCINYRVRDIEKIVKHLKSLQVSVKGVEIFPEGKFAWITDIDGNHIELWEDTSL